MSVIEKPCDNEAHPPSREKSNARYKEAITEPKIRVVKLLEFKIREVFGADRIGNVVVQYAINAGDKCPDKGHPEHWRKVCQCNSRD